MGIVLSNPRKSSPMEQFLADRVFGEARKRYVKELVERELEPLFESSVGDTKEEREKEGEARFREFMKGGGCKDIFKVMEDCVEESGSGSPKCKEPTLMLFRCFYYYPDYYKPILDKVKTIEQHLAKDATDMATSKKALRDELTKLKK